MISMEKNNPNPQSWSSTTENFGRCSPEATKGTYMVSQESFENLPLDIHGSCA